jgi:hypothetical protein
MVYVPWALMVCAVRSAPIGVVQSLPGATARKSSEPGSM